jgi:hypothetical protein
MSNEANVTLPVKLSVLPDSWVEKIFSKMSSLYGTLFSDRWRDCDLNDVKAAWAEELAGFSDNPECYGLALKAMVEECKFPPTLPEFFALCRKSYSRPQLGAIEYKLSPEDLERNKARAKEMIDHLNRIMRA